MQSIAVLVVDDNQYMRKVVRNLLVNLGVKNIHEAADGIAGLEAIRMFAPDLVILDWEMPLLNGAELVRIVRSPGVFPVPDVPIIMLTGHVERWRVIEAVAARRQRIPEEAGVRQGAARPHRGDPDASRARWCGSATTTVRSRASCSTSRCRS